MVESLILKIASSSNPTKIGISILKNLEEGKQIETLSIGAGATNQAIKGVIIARGLVAAHGKDLMVRPGFVDLTINNEVKTAIRFRIVCS